MKEITIHTLPYKEMRYPTVGDWLDEHIMVADMGNEDYEFLVALHELVEMYLCRKHGVIDEQVTDFDLRFEEERKNRSHDEWDEPGDDGRAPYFYEHQFAKRIESEMANELGVDFKDYNNTVLKVGKETSTIMSDEQATNQPTVPEEEKEQDSQPEGVEAGAGGQPPKDEEHEEGGTAENVGGGEGKEQDEVPQ